MLQQEDLLDALTNATLHRLAKWQKVLGRSTMRKDELVEALSGLRLPNTALLHALRDDELRRVVGAFGLQAHDDRSTLIATIETHMGGSTDDLPARRESLRALPLDDRIAMLRILAWLATRDHRFGTEELDFLSVLADALGLSEAEAEAAVAAGRKARTADEAIGALRSHATRHLLLAELVLLAMADGRYDARERTALRRIAHALDLPERSLERIEKSIVDAVEAAPETSLPPAVNEEESWTWGRIGMVAGAAVIGGAAIAATGGIAAPAIGGAVGSFMGLSGAAATSAGLAAIGGGSLAAGGAGMAGGAAVITGVFGVAGGATAAVKTARRTSGVEQFEFVDLQPAGARVVVGVSGWLSERSDFETDWKGLGEYYETAAIRALRWESKHLLALGKAIAIGSAGMAAKAGVGAFAKHATAAAGRLLGAPAAAFTALGIIDNPWSLARTKAEKTGKVLADVLVSRPWGQRPVTLVGFSLGTRVIHSALTHLSASERSGIIESVILLGGAVDAKHESWDEIAHTVSGPIVNGYCETDWVLKYLYRTTELARPIGLGRLAKPHIVDVDLTDLVSGHLDYRANLHDCLRRIDAEVRSTNPEYWI